MSRVLVTGAGGYIGSRLVAELLALGNEVTAYDRFFFGVDTLNKLRDNANLKIVTKDIRDIEERTSRESTQFAISLHSRMTRAAILTLSLQRPSTVAVVSGSRRLQRMRASRVTSSRVPVRFMGPGSRPT